MVCQRCGTFNNGSDQYCGNCGAALVSIQPPANRAPALPVSPYGSAGDEPTLAQPLTPAQPTQYVSPPTQYVPPAYSPGAGWAAPQASYALPPQATWADVPLAPQSPAVFPAGARPLSATRRRRRWPWYLLLFLVIFGLVAAGSWILLLRPAVHQSVDGEIRQGLQQAVDQIPTVPQELAPGVPLQGIQVTDAQINAYLAQNISQLAPITDMHISLQPDTMVVTFQAYGFGSTVRLGLAVEGGTLVAQNVNVSGLLWWVESNDDLTARFDEALSQVPGKMGRRVAAVSIGDSVMQFTFA
jgi:hypothetical protein